jgi:Fe-Mn family superoxide dismutase
MSDHRFDLSRRQLLVAGAVAALGSAARRADAKSVTKQEPAKPATGAPHVLMKLPYAEAALAPGISAQTVGLHYGKHHKGYVDKTNDLVKGTELQGKSLEDIIRATTGKADKAPLFNAASQAWNHDFYWMSMKPKGGGTPSGELGKKIVADFGSVDAFAKEFTAAATGQFGSGWAWLIVDQGDAGKLKVVKTSNADNPIAMGKKPILTIDVWEHAYYLDYQNRRPDYVKAFWDSLANWDFANENLAKKA